MSLPLIVLEVAQEDIGEAADCYERQSAGLSAEFVRCLDACLSLISREPEVFPEVHRGSRMALLRFNQWPVIGRVAAGWRGWPAGSPP